ncbi:MAG TPA: DUF748 domain-containing protein [Lacunisphaera sp.]|nr:DUF748 domain-containing protein [Lacunisphaera sp.]
MLWKSPQDGKSRWPRRLMIAGVLVGLFTIFGFFVAPGIVKAQLERRASATLGRTVTVRKVRLNPYAVSLTIEGLDIRSKDGAGSFLGWDRLYVNAEPLASIFGPWTAGAIELDGFHVTAELRPDGTFNFADIIDKLNSGAPASPAAPAKLPPALRIGSLKVGGARLDFIDHSRRRPFETILGPVSFGLTEFRTTGARGAPYHFEAVTEAGERLSWTGTLSADPVASTGELKLENILLAKYAPYYADRIGADLTEGKLNVGGRYEAKFAGGERVLKLADGAVQLRGLKLVERGSGETALELPALDVAGINADAMALKATVAAVRLVGGHVRIRREKAGALNLLALLAPPVGDAAPAPSPPATPAAPARLPEFTIGEVALKDFQAEVTDLAAPQPARLGLEGLQISLKNVTLADGAAMPLSLALNWAPAGTVKVEGTVAIKPELKAGLQVDVVGLDLRPLSPYLEQFINAHITQGTVGTTGSVQVAMAGETPAINFAGGVTVDKFGLVDGDANEDLAGFGSLALTGLKAATSPTLAVSLDEVNLAAPYARVLVRKDGTLNLATLAKTGNGPAPAGAASRPDRPASLPAQPEQKVPPPAQTAPPPQIEIGKVVINGGDASVADRSLEPTVRMAVTQFGGTISGLSSANLARADVDLHAMVNGAGPVSITGKLDPLGARRFLDLKVDCQNVDLVPLSPYSGKYAGYELVRGQLNVAVQAKLDDRQLDATNVITLSQFTFGAPVASPDATKLPVRLGVALLKDLDGRIVIDVPMTGSIDDPSLRLGKVVLRVVVNLLTKAAVSPFALLGSMFGGGGDELGWQEFAPGGSELQAAELKKLETMVKALANRPGLSVALEGAYDGPADTYALQRRKLAALVRSRIWEERHAADPNIASPNQLAITPEADATMVKKLFDEKFPPGTEFGAPLPPAPVAVAAPPARKGFLGRVVDMVTLKGLRTGESKPAEAAAPAPANAAGGVPPGPTLEEMTGRLAGTMTVDDNDLRALAAARAERVRDYFLHEGHIAADRLFLTQGKEQKENRGPRVFLALQ